MAIAGGLEPTAIGSLTTLSGCTNGVLFFSIAPDATRALNNFSFAIVAGRFLSIPSFISLYPYHMPIVVLFENPTTHESLIASPGILYLSIVISSKFVVPVLAATLCGMPPVNCTSCKTDAIINAVASDITRVFLALCSTVF